MKRTWLALWLCLLGCDGLGDPVVGELGPPRDPRRFVCEQPEADCETQFLPRVPFPTPLARTPSSFCPREPDDACLGAGSTNCVLALRVVEGVPVSLPMQQCTRLELTPAPDSLRPELRGLTASTGRIVLEADRFTTFVLTDVSLTEVAIELVGPVALELQGELRSVSILSDDPVQVTLARSTANTLAVKLPAGSLRVQDSRVSQSQIHAREMVLETVPLADVDLAAERLVGIELSGRRVRVDASDLSFSEVELNALELHRCDVALMVNTRLSQSVFASCSERLRVHSSAIDSTRITGTVESIGTYFSNSHFGPVLNTTLELWGGTLTSSILCPALQRLSISSQTNVTCVDCTQLARPEQHLCAVVEGGFQTDADAGVVVAGNDQCLLFDQGLPLCDPKPSPTSPR